MSTETTRFDEITFATDGSVATITLDRPKMLNAISARPGGTRDQIVAALELAESDDTIGAVVLRGAGRAFCGGGDLTGYVRRETEAEHRAFLEGADAFHRRITDARLPVIAAVHGHCLGAGLLLHKKAVAALGAALVLHDRHDFPFPLTDPNGWGPK